MSLSLWPDDIDTITGAGKALREGRTSCVNLVQRCLAKIDEWEPKIRAWVTLDREGAIDHAITLDKELQSGKTRGPLHGIPIGVKDIIDVAGMPTCAGVQRHSTGLAARDADIIARYRAMGAIILGKTVTTAYAFIDPPPTKNPWNLGRTPGGSSSGSAAAVATGMCMAALGTQTAGSVTRPASYCGVASLKPARASGAITPGIVPFAPTLDTVGVMARDIAGLAIMNEGLDHANRGKPNNAPTGRPMRLGWVRDFFPDHGSPEIMAALDRTFATLRASGAMIVGPSESLPWEELIKTNRTIMAVEAAVIHEERFANDPYDFPPKLAALIEEGQKISTNEYSKARLLEAKYRDGPRFVTTGVDAYIVPATTGPAPTPETTGNPAFNAPFTFMNEPTISLPVDLSDDGLPLAVQFFAPGRHQSDLFATVARCEATLRAAAKLASKGSA